MLCLADYSKLVEYIGCMEGTSLVVSKISIKGITESTMLVCKEFYDEYSPLGISE